MRENTCGAPRNISLSLSSILPVLPSQISILILHFAEEEGSSLPSISLYLIDRVADVIFLPRIALVTLP